MNLLEQFQNLGDLVPLELLPGGHLRYFCTPKDVLMLARAGVDGIHFCILPTSGDDNLERSPIYVVSPMASTGSYVAPVARSLPDFASYVWILQNAGVLELVHRSKWKEIMAYLAESDDAPFWGDRKIKALAALDRFPRTPCTLDREGVLEAVRTLQQDDTLYRFKFTSEYHEVTGE